MYGSSRSKLGDRDIPGYKGYVLGLNDFGAYVNQHHIRLALDWLHQKINSQMPDPRDTCPVTEDEIIAHFESKVSISDINKKDWTNWKDNSTREVSFPLRKLNSCISEWEKHLGVSSDCYILDNNIWKGPVIVDSPKLWKPKIGISCYCVSLAVVRLAIMHELYELRVASKYGFNKSIDYLLNPKNKCHQLACDKEKLVGNFESPSECAVRNKNVERWELDMDIINEEWQKNPPHDRYVYNRFRKIYTDFKEHRCEHFKDKINDRLIPGYCEIYEPYKYRDPKYSSIAWIFKAANLLGIRLPR